MLADGLLEVLSAGLEIGCEGRVAASCADQIRGLLQLHGHHGIGWDEVAQDSGVIAGTECAADESGASVERVPDPGQIEGFRAEGCLALEGVLVLDILKVTVEGWLGLGVRGVQESVQGEIPPAGEEFGGSGVFVEFVAQSEEVGQGVEFVFAFVDNRGLICWMHSILLAVACCLDSTRRRGLERVAVG